MQKNKSIHERIDLLVKKFGNGKNTIFAALIQSNEANIRGYIKGIVPKYDVLESIVRNLEVNPEWLLTGKGEMLKPVELMTADEMAQHDEEVADGKWQSSSVSQSIADSREYQELYSKYEAIIKEKENIKKEGIPLIPVEAMAGFGKGDMQILEYECERYVVPMFKEAEFLLPVKGSSMIPKYNSGDLVACRNVPLDTFFQWNKVYVLDTEQGAIIKRVKKGSDNTHILIVSDNPTYEPFELSLKKIRAIAVVVGGIRLE